MSEPDETLPQVPRGADAAQVRASIADTRAAAARRVHQLREQQAAAAAELAAAKKDLDAQFAARQAELDRLMKPMEAELARLHEASWTIDLYLGRDEEVTLLRDGRPAPADTPVTIRQMVLAADEESLALIDQGGVDYRSMDAFLEWVTASPENMARVVPDAKCVVVVIPSRQKRDYGDRIHDLYAEQANRQAHWLIRNGERLYLLVTDPELKVGDRLLPARDEFTSVFTEEDRFTRERRPLVPGSEAWLNAEQRAGALQRLYMRKMLVLQGLVDRSVVLHPLPVPGLNLMSLAAQEQGYVRLVNETDMALTDGRPRFREWRLALNRRLRPGMRVVLSTSSRSWLDLDRSRDRDRWARPGHRRLTPPQASYPPENVPLLVEDRRDGGLVIRYPRTDELAKRNVPVEGEPDYYWKGVTYVPATQRASCLVYPDDVFLVPFDAATEDDLLYYLSSREDRRSYLDMVPLLHSALKAKRQEREAETGFRQLLAGVILSRHPGADPGEVEADVPALVAWWKTGSRYARPLAGDPPEEAKAVEAIAREWDLRRRHAGNPASNTAAVGAAREAAGRQLLAVALTRSGEYKAWSPAPSSPWLTEYTITRAGGWQARVTGEWVTIPARTLATMRVLHASPQWEWWDLYPATGEILTGPETEALAAQLTAELEAAGAVPIVVTARDYSDDYGPPAPARRLTAYGWAPGADLTDLGQRTLDDYLLCLHGSWERDRTGQVTMQTRETRAQWERYSVWPQPVPRPGTETADRLGWPWRGRAEGSGTYWNPATSTRLVWSDAAQVSRVIGLHEARHYHAAREREAEEQAANRPYAAQIMRAAQAAWLAAKTAEARTRFFDDFGTGAADLWEHHLGTLQLDRAYRSPRWLDDMARRLARARVAVDGKTFAELAELDAELHAGDPADTGEWADWIIRLPARSEKP